MTMHETGRRTVTGWTGWVWFGGLMLVTVGLLQVFQGLVALFDDEFSAALDGRLVAIDLDTWGWAHVIMGALLVVAGAGVLGGTLWGRVLGSLVAAAGILVQITVLPVYPFWALVVIVLDALVIYALIVNGAEAGAV